MLQGVDGIKNYQLHTIFATTQKLNSVNMHVSFSGDISTLENTYIQA
jgi:hypothetical protein